MSPIKVLSKSAIKPHKPAPAARVKVLAAKPSVDLEAIQAQVADLAVKQAGHIRDRFILALERAKIKPDYHGFAMATLGDLDLSKASDLAKIDAFAQTHSAMREAPLVGAQPKFEASSAWLDARKTDPGKPRLGDHIPRSAIPREAGGDRP